MPLTAAGICAVLGIALLAIVLWDVFETIILPRRVTRRFRLARLFYRTTWFPWRGIARIIKTRNLRESFLSFFGPLSLLFLFAVWAVVLILSFSILHFAAGSAINAPGERTGYWTDLYMSGSTFFTLGLGDVTPRTALARVITVAEAGIGFGFLAIVISYLPVLYSAFSRREANISLLDARAGSPPTASEFLRRHTQSNGADALGQYLRDWELWAAELMESHLSYPVLCYFRSQHNNQSWLAALSAVLDVSALLLAYADDALRWQARMTFAISRHAIVDLAQVLSTPPRALNGERLPAAELQNLRRLLVASRLAQCRKEDDVKLSELRQMYEPYVSALADRLLMPVAGWSIAAKPTDNWRTSAWARISGEVPVSPLSESDEKQHF
jgi:hypothetical protein